MDWALHHLQLIIAIAGAVAWWLNQRRQEKAENTSSRPDAGFGDPELAQRTRRIREEIQRKIEQRAKEYMQPAPPVAGPAELPPVVREVYAPEAEPAVRVPGGSARLETQRTAEILEQQAALAEQLRLVELMKAAAARRSQFETNISSGAAATAAARGVMDEDLKNPEVLRRAFVLREVLGPPVSLR